VTHHSIANREGALALTNPIVGMRDHATSGKAVPATRFESMVLQ
jgi:hypothetical protein